MTKKDDKIINVNINNAYGIKSLNINLNKKNNSIIYARNGTGKTSFSKALFESNIKRNKKNKITKKNTFITVTPNNFEFLFFDQLSNKTIKDYNFGINIFNPFQHSNFNFDKFYSEIDSIKKLWPIKLFLSSKNYDFNLEDLFNILNTRPEKFLSIKNILSENDYNAIVNKYSDVFSKDWEDLIKSDTYKFILDYNKQYSKFVDECTILDKFTSIMSIQETVNSEVIKKLFDSFNVTSKKSNNIFTSSEDFINAINEEKDKIKFEVDKYKKKYKLDKIFNQNKYEFLENNNFFTNNITTIDNFLLLKDYINYKEIKKIEKELKSIQLDLEKYKEIYSKNTENFEEEWRKIEIEYKLIFKTPITVELIKKKSYILTNPVYSISFKLVDVNGGIEIDSRNIEATLSESEKRCIYIFDMLFKIENYKKDNKQEKVILLFDDIIDSFDLKNKHGIIYYLKKFENSGFRSIILTHNFSFFKLLYNKLRYKDSFVMSHNKGNIVLNKYDSFDNVQITWSNKNKIINDVRYAIGLIAAARIKTENPKEESYDFFTKCLHIKKNTHDIKINDIIKNIKNKFKHLEDKEFIYDNSDSYLKVLYDVCENIEYDKKYGKNCIIEEHLDKTCLAIGIRLKLEEKIINWLLNNDYNSKNKIEKITSNQTKELIVLYNNLTKCKSQIIFYEILSSDLIHDSGLNYEYTFGYSLNYFKSAYDDLNKLVLKDI